MNESNGKGRAWGDFCAYLDAAQDGGNVPELSSLQYQLCAGDLLALYDDETVVPGGTADVWAEWLRRLGGLGNVESYARSLEAGARWRPRDGGRA